MLSQIIAQWFKDYPECLPDKRASTWRPPEVDETNNTIPLPGFWDMIKHILTRSSNGEPVDRKDMLNFVNKHIEP